MPWQDVGKSCGDRHSALQGGFFCACRVCSSGRDSAGKSAYRFRSGSSSVVFLRIPPLAGIRGKGHCLQKKTSDDMPDNKGLSSLGQSVFLCLCGAAEGSWKSLCHLLFHLYRARHFSHSSSGFSRSQEKRIFPVNSKTAEFSRYA